MKQVYTKLGVPSNTPAVLSLHEADCNPVQIIVQCYKNDMEVLKTFLMAIYETIDFIRDEPLRQVADVTVRMFNCSLGKKSQYSFVLWAISKPEIVANITQELNTIATGETKFFSTIDDATNWLITDNNVNSVKSITVVSKQTFVPFGGTMAQFLHSDTCLVENLVTKVAKLTAMESAIIDATIKRVGISYDDLCWVCSACRPYLADRSDAELKDIVTARFIENLDIKEESDCV